MLYKKLDLSVILFARNENNGVPEIHIDQASRYYNVKSYTKK